MRRWFWRTVAALLLAAAAWVWYLFAGGVSHREIKSAVTWESQAIRTRLDDRSTALERRLDRIEGKLDRLLDLATAAEPLPDGMKAPRPDAARREDAWRR